MEARDGQDVGGAVHPRLIAAYDAAQEAFLDVRRDPWLLAPAAGQTLLDMLIRLGVTTPGLVATSTVVTGSAAWTAYALRSRRVPLTHVPAVFLLFFIPAVAVWLLNYVAISVTLGAGATGTIDEGAFRLFQAISVVLAFAGVFVRLIGARGLPSIEDEKSALEAWRSGWRETRADLVGSAGLMAVMTLLSMLGAAVLPGTGWLSLLQETAGSFIAQAVIIGGAKRL